MNRLLLLRFITVGMLLIIGGVLLVGCSDFWEEEYDEATFAVEQDDVLSKLNESQHHQTFDCDSFEIYDELSGECHPPESCETLEECSLLGDALVEQIMERFGNLLTDYELAGDGTALDEQELVIYELADELLVNPQLMEVDQQILNYRDDLEMHIHIWELFQYLIPEQARQMLSGFIIFTDGYEETLAHVEPDGEDSRYWYLGVDIMDAEQSSAALKVTLLHEFAHLLTLQESQLDMDDEVLFADEDDAVHLIAEEDCHFYFVAGMGCTKEDSYLNQLYVQFWTEIIDEWHERDVENDEEQAEEFFEKFEPMFVTDYAAVSPVEDIAEVWTYFILSPRPEGEEVWEEKILFFYQYPEQVSLRVDVLSRLLSYLSRRAGQDND